MELLLSTEEHQLLLDILEQRHRELLKEISHTDPMNSSWPCARMRSCSSPS